MSWRLLTKFLFPFRCLSCGREPEREWVICDRCFSIIRLNQTFFCGLCRSRLPNFKKTCHLNFPYRLGAAANYDEKPLKDLIHALKFQVIKEAAQPLGEILINYARELPIPWHQFTVVPIPLSEERQKERGFNQAELIARIFADYFQMPFNSKNLRRVKNTKPQSEARDFEKRILNMKGAFEAVRASQPEGERVVLVDDVTTSGATLFEAASVLKKAGVKKIIALTAAKT